MFAFAYYRFSRDELDQLQWEFTYLLTPAQRRREPHPPPTQWWVRSIRSLLQKAPAISITCYVRVGFIRGYKLTGKGVAQLDQQGNVSHADEYDMCTAHAQLENRLIHNLAYL